jgi:hypothetical protein
MRIRFHRDDKPIGDVDVDLKTNSTKPVRSINGNDGELNLIVRICNSINYLEDELKRRIRRAPFGLWCEDVDGELEVKEKS